MAAKLRYPELRSFEWLSARFVDDGLTRVAIAELVGASSGSVVGKALIQLGIERPPGWVRPRANGAMAPAPPAFDATDLELAELVNEKRHDPAPVERERRLPDGGTKREFLHV